MRSLPDPARAIKVCFLVAEFPLLSETFVVSQVVGLIDRGFDVTVICDKIVTDRGVDLAAEPLPRVLRVTRLHWIADRLMKATIRALPRQLRRHARGACDLLSDFRLNRYDVLLAQFGSNGRRLARAAQAGILRRPFATILHGVDVAEPYNQRRMGIYRTMFRQGALLLTVCALFRDIVVAAGADPARIEVLPTAVDCRRISYAERSWDESTGGPRIITVARLIEKKGVEYGLRALARLKAQAPDLAWRYDIIGDGPLRPALEALAAALGIADRVEFRGAQAHAAVQAALQAAHLFLLPSVTSASGDMEGVPVVLKEAMAAGLPVISSRHSGIPELIEDGVSGLLADERDDAALSAHLHWAIGNPAGCAALARAARARVEQHFDTTLLDDRLAGIVRDLAGRA